MSDSFAPTIQHIADTRVIDRGGGILTWPLISHYNAAHAKFTTGMSVYPKGQGAPMHSHNCDEQVTLLEGEGEVEIDGVVTPLKQYDSTYVAANQMHCFRNRGEGPMRILWVYASSDVTRTFGDSGQTVAHLSPEDMMGDSAA